jgi:hypothetical protein
VPTVVAGEREGGVDLCGGEGQRPFLLVGDATGVAVGEGQQALGLGIVFGPAIGPPRWLSIRYGGDSQSRPGRCVQAATRHGRGLSLLPGSASAAMREMPSL